MSKKPYKKEPGDFEVRIASDGRVYVVAADDPMFDLAEALDPNHPALIKRRKAKQREQAKDHDPKAGPKRSEETDA